MKVIEKILNEIQQKNIQQKDFCSSIGVSTSTFSNWKTRGTDPPVRYLKPICEYFGWKPNELISDLELGFETSDSLYTDVALETQPNQMCKATKELIECYNGLSLSNKAKVMTLVAALQQEEANG